MSDPASRYGDYSRLVTFLDPTNLIAYSDLAGTGNVDTVRVQQGFDLSDVRIDQYLKRYLPVPVASTDTGFLLLQDASVAWTALWLYSSRGQRDVTPIGEIDYGKEALWEKQGRKRLDQFIEARLNNLPPGTFQSIPLEHDNEAIGVSVLPGWWW